MARFYQRITDIFEKDESKPREEKSFSQSDLIRKQRPSYRTLITDDWEAKNKKVNEGVEQRRGLKEFGYLRQSYLLSAQSQASQVEESQVRDEDVAVDKYHKKKIEYFQNIANSINSEPRYTRYDISCSKTDFNQRKERRDRNPHPGSDLLRRFVSKFVLFEHFPIFLSRLDTMPHNRVIPARIIQPHKEREDGKFASSLRSDEEGDLMNYGLRRRRWEERGPPGGEDCRLRRRYTNRENRLARQMLDHIRTQSKWTSGVDRPFVLGI